ncbi:MAG: hypothetical protein N2114_01315 [Candidatus Goldbacteria bacterium]|nr:hypothetical protein [Candidatus Goldiibacteriota bacterium]
MKEARFGWLKLLDEDLIRNIDDESRIDLLGFATLNEEIANYILPHINTRYFSLKYYILECIGYFLVNNYYIKKINQINSEKQMVGEELTKQEKQEIKKDFNQIMKYYDFYISVLQEKSDSKRFLGKNKLKRLKISNFRKKELSLEKDILKNKKNFINKIFLKNDQSYPYDAYKTSLKETGIIDENNQLTDKGYRFIKEIIKNKEYKKIFNYVERNFNVINFKKRLNIKFDFDLKKNTKSKMALIKWIEEKIILEPNNNKKEIKKIYNNLKVEKDNIYKNISVLKRGLKNKRYKDYLDIIFNLYKLEEGIIRFANDLFNKKEIPKYKIKILKKEIEKLNGLIATKYNIRNKRVVNFIKVFYQNAENNIERAKILKYQIRKRIQEEPFVIKNNKIKIKSKILKKRDNLIFQSPEFRINILKKIKNDILKKDLYG